MVKAKLTGISGRHVTMLVEGARKKIVEISLPVEGDVIDKALTEGLLNAIVNFTANGGTVNAIEKAPEE